MIKKLLVTFINVIIIYLIILATGCSSNSPENTASPASTPVGQPTITQSNTSAGIVVSPSVESPWPELEVYKYPLVITYLEVGKEFSIGLDVNSRIGHWTKKYAETILSLQDEQVVYNDPLSSAIGTTWFRFKAISEGNAFITFDLITSPQESVVRLTYIFSVTK